MKTCRVFLFTICVVITITITSAINPVEQPEALEEEGVARPIRGTSETTGPSSTRKRGRVRYHKHGGGIQAVQKRRLPTSFRPTRAPLFEASPPDPFLELGAVGPTAGDHYGHSHSPPTANPYYSPSRYERERKRQRVKSVRDGIPPTLEQNEFEPEPAPQIRNYSKRPKNYAFAYAVGDDAEDFSHKQAKEGPLTIGEYRITLPDGRTQVVRYTAGDKSGYKADVTYENPRGHPQPQPVSGGHHGGYRHNGKQYHEPVQLPHQFAGTPSPSFHTNRVYKSKQPKIVTLSHNTHADIEYNPPSHHSDDEDEEEPEYKAPAPKIRLRGGNSPPRVPLASPTPTAADFFNSVSPTPTPRPNSIYDKISPYRGGAAKYAGNDDLAYAHENSPRAGPSRGKKAKNLPSVGTTAATYFDSPVVSPTPHRTHKINGSPTKKYKDPGAYHTGAHHHVQHQPQANHVNEYIRPHKHLQYLQETPIHHHQHLTEVVPKPVKESSHRVVPLDHYKSAAPVQVSYAPAVVNKPRKPKKNKQVHGIHQPLGQYLIQSPPTVHKIQPHHVTPYHPTAPAHLTSKEPFQYFNSFHQPHHHGYGQIAPSPSPITSVRHSESPFPNPYPVTAFPSGHGLGAVAPTPPRLELPSPPSTAGHVYLETPASGERPNRLGIKEALARLPGVSDLPPPKTTIHPYEVGAADYGKGVAYGHTKSRDKGFGGGASFPFDENVHTNHGLDHLDPTNSLFGVLSTPSGGVSSHGGEHTGYFPQDVADHFNFLEHFDIEQANVREIRQEPRQKRGRGNANGGRQQRRPDKRRGVPATGSSSEEITPPPNRTRQRQAPASSPKPNSAQPPTTTRANNGRGRRRRLRTQNPETIIHESRRVRPRSRGDSSN